MAKLSNRLRVMPALLAILDEVGRFFVLSHKRTSSPTNDVREVTNRAKRDRVTRSRAVRETLPGSGL